MSQFLRLAQVRERVGLSRSSIYQAVAEGTFPRPVPIGSRAVGWVAQEVDQWIEAQIAKRESRELARVR